MRLRALALVVLCATLPASAASRGWLGCGFSHRSHDGKRWLVVERVASAGPAEKAGVRVGDIITGVDVPGAIGEDAYAVLTSLDGIRPHDTVRLYVRRATESLVLTITAWRMSAAQQERWLKAIQTAKEERERSGRSRP